MRNAPLRTEAARSVPSDLTNVLFIGSREELEAAFQAADWKNANHLGLKLAFEELQAAARKSGYDQAPVSLLTLNGAPPDIVFQKALKRSPSDTMYASGSRVECCMGTGRPG